MFGTELAVGYVFFYVIRKARRVAGAADEVVDQALDAGVERVHDLVVQRLSGQRALARLEEEATAGAGELSPASRRFLQLAIEDAADSDPGFAQALQEAVAVAAQAGKRRVLAADEGVAVGGDLAIKAEGCSAAALWMGDMTLGNPPLPGPTDERGASR